MEKEQPAGLLEKIYDQEKRIELTENYPVARGK
jgi:hypothetical protein